MAKLLTKEQYKILIPYEERLNQAKSDYIRGLYADDVLVLEKIYNELGYHLESRTCGSCILYMGKILADYYNKYKQRYYSKNETDKADQQ